jgi:hypothetical protein
MRGPAREQRDCSKGSRLESRLADELETETARPVLFAPPRFRRAARTMAIGEARR